MAILIFSEEYIKITKGMFAAWMSHACEASKGSRVDILLNKEHWAFEETIEAFRGNSQVLVSQLPFNVPLEFLKRALGICDRVWLLRAIIFVLTQAMNVSLSPVIIFYLALRFRQTPPTGDDLELAKAITKLLTGTDLRNKMGEAGYQRLKRLFTSEKMAANYDALLQKC